MILQPSPARARQSALPRLRAPPVTRATRPLMPRSTLSALEFGRALLKEGLDTLARVFRLEDLLEGAHLDLDGVVDGRLNAVVDRLDDEAGGDGRPLDDLPRQGLGVVEGLAFLGEAIDETDPVALLGGNLRAQDEVLESEAPADQSRESLGPAKSGNDAQVRLGLSNPRRLLQDADMAGHRDLASAAQ